MGLSPKPAVTSFISEAVVSVRQRVNILHFHLHTDVHILLANTACTFASDSVIYSDIARVISLYTYYYNYNYYYTQTYTFFILCVATRAESTRTQRNTSSSAVAKRPLDASCHRIFC